MTKLRFNNLKQYYIKNRLFINCFLLFCLYILNCYFYMSTFFLYSILLIFLLLDDLKNGFSYILYNIPFCLLGNQIGIILYVSCILVLLIKSYIILFVKDKIKIDFKIIILTLILVLYCLLPFKYINTATFVNISAFLFLILILNLYYRKKEIFDVCLFIRILSISIMLASLLGLLYPTSDYLSSLIQPIYLTENISRFSALFSHPNTLAIMCEICLSLLTFLLFTKKNTIDIIIFSIISIVGIFTFSKTFIILFSLLLITIFIKCMIANYKKTLIVSFIVLLCAICILLIFPTIFSIFVDRFIGSINECNNFYDFMNMLTTDRFSLWTIYCKEIVVNPVILFFGKGVGAHTIDLLGAHNTFISLFYQMGIIGVALLSTIIGIIIAKIVKTHGFNNYALIPIFISILILSIEDLIIYG